MPCVWLESGSWVTGHGHQLPATFGQEEPESFGWATYYGHGGRSRCVAEASVPAQ